MCNIQTIKIQKNNYGTTLFIENAYGMVKKFINDFQQNVQIGSKHSLEFGIFSEENSQMSDFTHLYFAPTLQ